MRSLTVSRKLDFLDDLLAFPGVDESIGFLLDDIDLRDHLMNRAFADFDPREAANGDSSEAAIRDPRGAAIRVVSMFDPASAFLAAGKAMKDPRLHDRECYPYLLVEMDREKAVPVLLSQALVEESTAVVWAIGRSLAGSDRPGMLDEWLISSDPERRRAACRLAGRARPTSDLSAALEARLGDDDERVAEAARESLHLSHSAQEVKTLIDALGAEQDVGRRWDLLDSLLLLGDPGDEGQPQLEWARQASECLPYLMGVYIDEQLKKRRNEVEKEAKARDREAKRRVR